MTNVPWPAAAAAAPARGVGAGPSAIAGRIHVHVAVSSTWTSFSIWPSLAAPPNTMTLEPAAAAACRPRDEGAGPVVPTPVILRDAASKISTEVEQRWVCTSTRGPSGVRTAHATCREVGPCGIVSARRSHCKEPRLRHHMSSKMLPPVPAVSGSQPPKTKSSLPMIADAAHRRPPGWSVENCCRDVAGCRHSHVLLLYRQRSFTTSRGLSPSNSA
mmetsp:Transcript_23232/g.75259  ORF Transcript_23232/g.75259 Transcript_23232/m.75259 type:complete len:216 (+) Transcript_23232:585-1232(+)